MRKPSKLLLGPEDQDLSGAEWEEALEDATPKHSLKIYKADQTYRFFTTPSTPRTGFPTYTPTFTHRFLLVNKDTKAREVVMLSLKEFGITECSTNFALVEVRSLY